MNQGICNKLYLRIIGAGIKASWKKIGSLVKKEDREKSLYIDFAEKADVRNYRILVWKDLWDYCSPVVAFWYCCWCLFIKEFYIFTILWKQKYGSEVLQCYMKYCRDDIVKIDSERGSLARCQPICICGLFCILLI